MPKTNKDIIDILMEIKVDSATFHAQTDAKIDGITRRQDITNGRIAKAEEKIEKLETNQASAEVSANLAGVSDVVSWMKMNWKLLVALGIVITTFEEVKDGFLKLVG